MRRWTAGGRSAPAPAGIAALRSLSRPSPARTASEALAGFQMSSADGLDELLVVLFVLVGVALGEVGDGPVEPVTVAQVRADSDRISRSGVRPSQRPAARAGIEHE